MLTSGMLTLHATALSFRPTMHRYLLRQVPQSCLYISHAWLFLGGAWRRGNSRRREHFSKPVVHTSPQMPGTVFWVGAVAMLGLLPAELCYITVGSKDWGEGKQKARLGNEMKTLASVAFIPRKR